MNIRLNKEKQPNITVLSNDFITKYMVRADGEFVKIYLMIVHLVQNNAFTGLEQIADVLQVTEKDVVRAVRYWMTQGLLEADERLIGTVVGEPKSDSMAPMKENNVLQMARKPVFREPMEEKPAESAAGIQPEPKKNNPSVNGEPESELGHCLYMAEMYLARPLSKTETQTFSYIMDELGFSSELLEYLIEYCVSKEKKSVRYMESVAVNWHDQGIDTVEKAKNQSQNYNQSVFGIMKAFGIKERTLTKVEMEYIRKWNKMGFLQEIIEEACSRTIISAHSASFPYANSILESWNKAGVQTLEDIRALDEKHRAELVRTSSKRAKDSNRFGNFEQRASDYYDAIEAKSL